MTVCGKELYVGTTWGCIIVAEALSMRPITVFRPYQDEVRAILPIFPASHHNRNHTNAAANQNKRRKSTADSTKKSSEGVKSGSDQKLVSPSSSSNKSISSSFSVSSSSTSCSSTTNPADYLNDETNEEEVTESPKGGPMVVTLGRGYRNLLSRYAPMPKSVQQDANSRQMYALLWRANSWNI